MKILYIITKSEIGGAQTHVSQLSNYFSSNCDVAVLSSPNGWLKDESKKNGITFFSNKYSSNSLNPFKLIKFYKKIKSTVEEFKPDIVHCHSTMAGMLGRLVLKNSIPTVFTSHGWDFDNGVSWLRKCIMIVLERYLDKFSSATICVSNYTKQIALKHSVSSKSKMHVIYNGVEPKENKQYAIFELPINIVFVGRLSKQKNPLLLLQTYNNLDNSLKEQNFVQVIGYGPDLNSLKQFVINNDLEEKVSFLQGLSGEQVYDKLYESNIFVLTTNWEGLPYTILEAMSVGLPIIASDVGGIKEAVEDGVNGFLLKDNSIEELKVNLEKLVKNKELREKMGKASRKKVLDKFLVDKMLKETENLYNEIINK